MSVAQRSAPRVLIRCDGSEALGLGHVVRCLALADVFHGEYGWEVSFCMRQGPLGIHEVQKRGYAVHHPEQENPMDDSSWFGGLMSGIHADVLICDVRDDLQMDELQAFRDRGIMIALLDDLTSRRMAADMVFYPPIPQLDGLDWKGYGGRIFAGWEWVVLRRDVRNVLKVPITGRPRILITMGGSDPFGFTLKAVQAMEQVRHNVDVVAVLGPGFIHGSELSNRVARMRRKITIKTKVFDLPTFMAQADLVVGAFGTTAFELAVIGVPGIYLCASADHAESARALTNAGLGVSLGLGSEVDETVLAETIDQEIAKLNRQSRNEPKNPPYRLIDGFGAERAAEQIVLALKERDTLHDAVAVP